MEINYIGESLAFGKFGDAFVSISFVSAILFTVAYLLSFKNSDRWKNFGRVAFAIHALSVFAIIGLLLYLIKNHFFEYYYVWFHSSMEMPARYIFSCFWEGQEGSFLLWSFWHVILSGFILLKGGKWEAPVLSVMGMTQVFLSSMILGIYVFGEKIGSNPFILLREHPDMLDLPFTKSANYLEGLDGRGLNPLLQNYWMMIHPPVLFLGFASTAIPFAYAVGGLMTSKPAEWVRPALPYAFFGVMILSTGILMGAAWAYEALSFGGFWAWDPVENASLVPLLTFIGAAHLLLIFKRTKRSLLSAILLTVVTFILILYSTFLTRSGILGDTSVHAFTDLGMSGHLLLYMLFFTALPIVFLIINWKKIPRDESDDKTSSREFWMFIGVLTLLISAIQITFATSIPVWNKLFSLDMAPPADAVDYYNSWQIPIAVVICILMGITQYLKYRKTTTNYINKNLWPGIIASLVLTAVSYYFLQLERVQYVFLLFASIYAVIGNIDYLFRILKGKVGFSGASVAHVGVALILLGSLISNSQQKIISNNQLRFDLGDELPNNENIMLIKGDTLPMGNYFVSYQGKEKKGVNIFYNISYSSLDRTTGKMKHEFTLKPVVQTNKMMGNVSEPDTRHFFDKDIYTHVTYAEIEPLGKDLSDDEYLPAKERNVEVGDTIITSNSIVVVDGIVNDINRDSLELKADDFVVGLDLQVMDINKDTYIATPLYLIRNRTAYSIPAEIEELGVRFIFEKVLPDEKKFVVSVAEKKSNKREFIVMKAIVFPYINILWTGCILMIIGSWIAIRKRIAENRRDQ